MYSRFPHGYDRPDITKGGCTEIRYMGHRMRYRYRKHLQTAEEQLEVLQEEIKNLRMAAEKLYPEAREQQSQGIYEEEGGRRDAD